ncbi:MAG: DUF2974 domain-containing protein [Lactobacillaceae bacterium]|jgi:hypothetical protein|nr:DUF2974 domain-containing protein [Lactobacillaceae bacterium]
MNQITENDYLNISMYSYEKGVDNNYVRTPKLPEGFNYKNSGGGPTQFTIKDSTFQDIKLESNGLQANLAQVNGQKVISFRGTETSESNDLSTDAGLNNPLAYQDSNNQFIDAKKYVQRLLDKGLITQKEITSGKVTFTGHSLGGAIASYTAVNFGGNATVFSAPSAYNYLSPIQRITSSMTSNYHIENLRYPNDDVPNLPLGVPKIGKQEFLAGANLSDISNISGATGHMLGGVKADKNGSLKRSNQLTSALYNAMPTGVKLGGYFGILLAPLQTAVNGLSNFSEHQIKFWTSHPKMSSSQRYGNDRAYAEGDYQHSIRNYKATGQLKLDQYQVVDLSKNISTQTKEKLDKIQKINSNLQNDVEDLFSEARSLFYSRIGNYQYLTQDDVDDVFNGIDRNTIVDSFEKDQIEKKIKDQKTYFEDLANKLSKHAQQVINNDKRDAQAMFLAKHTGKAITF